MKQLRSTKGMKTQVPVPAAGLPQPASASETTRLLDGLLDGLASGRGIRNAVLAVQSTDGSFSWAGARGAASPDGTPMSTGTPYFIASIDKLFTAVVIMKLQERAQLNLDDTLAALLPASLTAGLHRLDGHDRTDAITVRHLLGHTSGLANYLEDRPQGGTALINSLLKDGDRSWDINDVTRIVRKELKPHFPPQPVDAKRQAIRYSDTNYALLQAIIEAVTGQELHEVFDALLFTPLGLQHTWLAGHPRATTADLQPATLWAGEQPLQLPLAMRSQRAVYSTARDQLAFMQALAQGRIFADPGTFGMMQQRWLRFGFPFDPAALRAPSWPIEYGLGIKRFRVSPLLTGFRAMPALFGHSGSTGTWLFHSPELDLLLAGAVNQVTAGAVPYRFLPKAVLALAGLRRSGPDRTA